MENKEQYLNKLMKAFQKDYGIILSYGESHELIPVGTFGVTRFLNVNQTPYSTDMKTVEKTDDKRKQYCPILNHMHSILKAFCDFHCLDKTQCNHTEQYDIYRIHTVARPADQCQQD